MKNLLIRILTIVIALAMLLSGTGLAEELGEANLYALEFYEGEYAVEAPELEPPQEEFFELEPMGVDVHMSDGVSDGSDDEPEHYAVAAVPQSSTPEKYSARPRIEVSGYLGKDIHEAAAALNMNEQYSDPYFTYFNGQYSPFHGADGMYLRMASVMSMERYKWIVDCICDYYEFSDEEDIDYSAYPSLSIYGIYCGQSNIDAKELLAKNGWVTIEEYSGSGVYSNSSGEYLMYYTDLRGSYDTAIVNDIRLYTYQGWQIFNAKQSYEEIESAKPAPTAISLDKTGILYINPGDQTTFIPILAPENAARLLSWKSSNPDVASVSQWGVLQAKKEGKTKITVTTKNKKKTSLTVMVVDPNKPASIDIANGKSTTIAIDETLQLNAVLSPVTAQSTLSWKSSKPQIAIVDENGIVTPIQEGITKITAVTGNRKKATIAVQVVDPYKPTAISIAQGKSVQIVMGQPLQLNVGLAPESARATLTWASSKGKVATVDGNGLVTPVGEGTTKITVRTQNKKKATISVKVVDPNKPLEIAIAQGKAVTMKVSETLQLGVGLNPATAQSALTWKTNKPAIATVDANGIVTAVKKGKAKITVTTYNKKKATITVNVVP